MREKINQAAKGSFEYESSKLELTMEELQVEVNAGEIVEGTFAVTNEKKRVMRGIVNSDCHFMEFEEDFFQGASCELRYIFHGETLHPGETIKGTITLITDCGTRQLGLVVNVGVPACEVSTGKIRDLFHFTNLAKENLDEASTLFRNMHFEDVFLQNDSKDITLYRGLSKGTSKGMALEEFLIAVRKKLPIQLSVNKQSFSYDLCENNFTDQFILTKNNWGFGEYHIKSDSDFVIPEHKIIWAEDFIGNSYTMPFLIDVDKMKTGKNYARITVSTVCQKIEITITASKVRADHIEAEQRRKEQKKFYELTKYYLDFCMGRLETEIYLSKAGEIVYGMNTQGMTVLQQLIRIHLGILEHRESIVKDGLDYLTAHADRLKKEDGILYCAYLYLNGLWTGHDEISRQCVAEIEEYYKRNPDDWRYLWFLLYLSPSYQSERKKYEDIVGQLEKECHSPIMFVEVCSILNESSDLLTILTPGICEAIHWGSKQKYVEKEVALRYSYLTGKMRNYNKAVLRDLCRFYEQYEEDEILTAICKMLMKGQITSPKAFRWYELGVSHNLKLTDLYEYYMYSIDESQEIHLQNSTLLYFLYDNHLTISKKAMLYAYVIKNKEGLSEAYEAYRQVMEDFALRQLSSGRISSNLAVLYEEFIKEDCINETIAGQLPEIMFCHEILCENPDMIGVYVMHQELKKEEFVPFVKGKAKVDIFTENYQIFLTDHLDNRYVLSVDYTVNKMLQLDHLAAKCLEQKGGDYRLLLYLHDKAERMNQTGKETMEIRRRVLELPDISSDYYKKAFGSLVHYYYDNFEGELLDSILEKLDWDDVQAADRVQFIEYCTVRRFFDKAMEGIQRYGYENIEGKRLLKLSSDAFAQYLEDENIQLVKLAWHIFSSGHFDENMMRYLCKYYTGRAKDMVQIWKFAKGFSIDTADFSERILGQIIFTEEMPPDAYEIFYEYYKAKGDKRLIWGFMKFLAYKYLVHGWLLPKEVFEYFYKEVQVQDNIFCLVASLRNLSKKSELTEEEKKFADYHVNKLYEKKIVFPFYRDFYGKLSLPIHILDEFYVSYTANPEYEVKIHYLISSGYEKGEFVTETMRDIFYGIRVKEFVLFQDEILQYYISELRPEGEVITKSASVHFDETMDSERTSSRYHMLNLMMIAQEMNEESTLIDMMEEYVTMNECVNTLFKPIE